MVEEMKDAKELFSLSLKAIWGENDRRRRKTHPEGNQSQSLGTTAASATGEPTGG